MADTITYQPSKSLGKRIGRRLAPLRARRRLAFNLERPIVSFSFDDCPQSALRNGITKLDALGWKSTIYIAPSLLGTANHHGLQMNEGEVRAAHSNGHEIGGHSFSHIDLTQVNEADAMADIEKGRRALSAMGLPPCKTFAYPYGQTMAGLKTRLGAEYAGLRGIESGVMRGQADLNQIRSTPLFRGERFDALLGQIRSLGESPAWLTLFTHDITDNPTDWGCTPAQMDAVIKAVQSVGAEVLPVAAAIDNLKASS